MVVTRYAEYVHNHFEITGKYDPNSCRVVQGTRQVIKV